MSRPRDPMLAVAMAGLQPEIRRVQSCCDNAVLQCCGDLATVTALDWMHL